MNRDEQIAQQIQDLNDLERQEDGNDDGQSVDPEQMEIDSEDSDAAEMRRLISYD